MDNVRVDLLKKFYSSIDMTKAKIEVKDYGFDFLKTMRYLQTDYAEYQKGIHKYRFLNIPQQLYDKFLECHVRQTANICGYFDKQQNNVFALNIDSLGSTLSDEAKSTAGILIAHLNRVGIEPLVIGSGRGWHLWSRLSEPMDNEVIFDFTAGILAWTKLIANEHNVDMSRISIGNYPNNDEQQTYSLRLFGSRHIRTGEFSHVYTKDRGGLSERDSWIYFQRYIDEYTMKPKQLLEATKKLSKI